MKRKLLPIFIFAFLLNVTWENLHSFFYLNYRGGAITEMILLRAAFVDAIIIVVGFYCGSRLMGWRRMYFLISLWLAVAIIIEWWALGTGRWAYADTMPIVPFVNIGLLPMIQLVITGAMSDYLVLRGN